ncbi:hypothetical protein MSAR_06770 [Mycolicibacterium sarraceniae]|uniref:Uncharacterized protein n=1 Tax=Mycolicibacterium sarraceniae TaxID=1534348 RepID=A0A7I7SM94_9MYCO|nr:hypothetical protein MSAR_06770 [Mycolicibacterium sarraceniae]
MPGEKFELEYVVQPGGRGSVTAISVSLSSGICSPETPTLYRYSAIGCGLPDVVGAGAVVVAGVVHTEE